MFNFDRSSISQKLTMISVLSTGSALLLVFIAFAATSVLSHKEDEGKQLLSLAGVIGTNSVTSLLFADKKQAEQTLAALGVKDEITQAALFDRDGKPFARYVALIADEKPEQLPGLSALRLAEIGAQPVTETSGPFWAPEIRLYRPIRNNQEIIGTVMIEADLIHMWLGILRHLGAISGATLFSFLLALFLAARFKGVIAEPITKLINAAQKVSSSQTYTHRILHQRSDELGTLIDSFNDMLAQIDSRDATLAHYRGQLERQVSVRTEQLEKAKNAAESASQAKSAFLATMSHEIRTPMNGVLGMTELLLASQLTEQQRHYTSMVKRSGENLLVIINDILDFSKIEAGKLTVEYIRLNFRELLDDIDHVFSPQANAKNIRLEFDIANDIPIAISGDPNRLRQVIVNLLGNAIKFTESGKITVKVQVAGEDAQTVSLRFEVHDTGIGVSSEAQTRIFESFSQADGSTTRKHGGTGLGLAISKQLVELMGGKIGVDNALTQGSIFWFEVNFDKRRIAFDDASFNPKTTQGIRALIVDQTPGTREVLEGQLASWHIASDSAVSATDGLQKLYAAAQRGQPYDVALLDMELPRTSGLALAATIKADPLIADIKLLLLSTDRGAADTVQRREAGVAFQLIKPARECDLFDCIVTPMRASEGMRISTPHLPRPASSRKRRKVLLAEDNPVNIEVAIAMLDGLGLEVVCAHNGEQALNAARRDDFDLILMDCQMPVMDGFAATAEIRRHEQQCGHARLLPIVAITANALQGDREACLAAGMDDYLSKPFTQQELGHTIARWITLPRAATVHHDELPPRPAPATPAPVAAPAPMQLAARKPAAAHNINRHALDNIRALSSTGGDALLERVIHAFVDDTPQQFLTLRAAIDSRNTGNLRKAAHSLKSSSANVGADTLAQLCKDMETLGRNDSTEGAAGLLSEMEQEFHAVRLTLSAILEKEI
ncbi:response regulator [Janthinobacterium agaricidamnosum]|uniref:Sensory/regulatory protein RpfC n=1 Tax=Janthinobacterium agaricidamnosum NBRC 102515 = DSM 9628 TaxID=1349767 RepID=W0V948_9BURK|nr:response regulator [Janthinobacterium agaricidamnosum]CDG84401.1 HAMP domain protein [Janthinobacterium agaricidamnosum NBRC 102515 = DSM 9628]